MRTKNAIIGFGKAGKTLAAALAAQGESVVLLEKSAQMYGGTCINIGCIPSKKLIEAGKTQDFASAMQEKNSLITALRAANFQKLDDLSNVQVLTAQASFIDEHTLLASFADGSTQTIHAERIFINTGTTPRKLAMTGADLPCVYDSTQLLAQDERPDSLVIVGAGFIALEFAFMFAAFGTQVTLLERGEFLPNEDDIVRETLQSMLAKHKINVLTNCETQAIIDTGEQNGKMSAIVQTSQGEITTSAVLIAAGRVPNTSELNLENAGVQTDERGYVLTDGKLHAQNQQGAIAHIWALGDVAGSPQFTYISLDDYRIVRDELLGDVANGTRTKNDRTPFATCVFTNPPLAHIGKKAKDASADEVVLSLPASAIVKAKVLKQTDGVLQAVVNRTTGQITGVTLLCAESHELINLFKLAMDHGIPASYFKHQIFTHPTIAEGLNDLFAQF
ncbi:pyridine nucleotide-disulfide oxidoreductase [Moraxella caviae]|uniref:Pyridine nucleotide-disulfide oxidoreductase n=1 Tax=Moraxella caviae TaxID=34060 RepID=A0A1S9ZS00_9GAMM|nr:pyridine nucleotide-disulfide oxidoreductase [Moraxella caviae]